MIARKEISSLFLLVSVFLLTGCEKDLNFDYHQSATQYVVEGSVSNQGMQARISLTNAVEDNTTTSDLSGATVIVTGDDGSSTPLNYTSNGYYRSTKKGTPGVVYTLDVTLDDHHFTSTSTMQDQPKVNQFRVIRKKIMTEWFQLGDLRIQDLANQDNWYFMHVYRNGLGYRWAVMSDRNDPNQELQQLFTFFREGSTDNDVLREGDALRIEIRAIDQRAYDYLYSMQVMESTGTNPIANFSGGCLGYFSAYGGVTINFIYHAAEVEEDDEKGE